ncbi:hypothetical protein A1O3_03010 [Capronia epimyces CBS 606.96]|uniref:Rhodopsin domain-containing protein n=1 Tax=Capronia epimyces CBS 606.96 TaxID=1182542 RepID=W9YBS6_9EURO|nr:uncharacterized protein A1O3_03010 [Capronia epimyces CBS 606.96]EXJ89943.1 hypothetical protein A1O3_03010 [Capronia epimyces CBS 606.96]
MALVDGVPVAMAPPPGYVVDFEHPHRQSMVSTYAIFGVGNVLSILFLGQRLFVKATVRHKLGIDDVCVLLAWVASVAIQSMIVQGYSDGYIGIHLWELPLPKFVLFLKKGLYIYPIIYALPPGFSKTALLIFYLQLGNRQQWYQISIWVTMAVVIGSSIGILFGNIFACSPISKFWDLTLTTGTCINRLALYKATAIFGIITDIMIIGIPIPMVVGLHISRKKKAGLLFMFTIGSATVVTSIVRLVILIQSFSTADQPWSGGPVTLWICVEANLLIMCACLPTLRQFMSVVTPKLLSSGHDQESKPSEYKLHASGGAGNGSALFSAKRRQYQGFGHGTDYHMDTLIEGANSSNTHHSVKHTDGGDGLNDDDSEKAIVQTKAVEIHYEPRPRPL